MTEEPPKSRNFWTKEVVTAVALKCKSLKEFRTKYRSAYLAAHRNQFLSDVVKTAGLESAKHNWTDEEIIAASQKYTLRMDFKSNDSAAYQASRSRGRQFHEAVCAHMTQTSEKFDQKEAFAQAAKCQSRTELLKIHPKLYEGLKRNKLLDEAFPHLRTLSLQEAQKLAQLCTTKAEFRERFPEVYTRCLNMKWLGNKDPLVGPHLVRSNQVQSAKLAVAPAKTPKA